MLNLIPVWVWLDLFLISIENLMIYSIYTLSVNKNLRKNNLTFSDKIERYQGWQLFHCNIATPETKGKITRTKKTYIESQNKKL